MPYADNLYSMTDESDGGDDYADQLSPTDGYFSSSLLSSHHAIPNVPNILIPDSTLQQTLESGAESKAREAEAESSSSGYRRVGDSSQNYDHTAATSGITEQVSHSEQHATSSSAAPHQQQPNPALAHTYLHSSSSHTSFGIYPTRGRTLSVYSDAPPAYSPPPASPPSSTANQQRQSISYSTFNSTMGVQDIFENERLLARDPESIGQPIDEEHGDTPHWTRRVRRRLPMWLGWSGSVLSLIIMAISIFVAVNYLRTINGDDHRKIIGAQPVEGSPPSEPIREPVTEPGTDVPVVVGPFQPTYCDNAVHRFEDQILGLNFDRNHNITFMESQHAHSGNAQVRVAGQVNVRRLDAGGSPRLVLEIATNDKGILLDTFTDEDAQAMKISVPKKYNALDPNIWPCVEMRATIWVPEDAEIGVLSLGSAHLDMLFLDDLSLHVAGYTRVSSIVGDITSGTDHPTSYNNSGLMLSAPDYTFIPARDSYVLDSRIIEVSTTSGKIEGNWPLYDMLGLHTTSGHITVSITPKEELKTDPKAAVLSLSSISGAVSATEPVHLREQIPLRDYLVDVKSTSGGIHGALAFGAGIELKSTASDIALDLLPVMNEERVSPNQPARLETVTTSGSTAIRILEPVWHGDRGLGGSRSLNCLQSLHKSTSGDMGLRYPQAWEGYLRADTTSGRLRVKGRDVKIVKSVGGWPGSTLEAQKGANGPGSSIQVHVLMGNMEATIGREE
ncbi:uncharacterized protein F4812DRAFT_201858 [Daldinia caldariorum]|uniref:uncharacterized protein n=1 Tax=Daldinia caldariorum TaxID=326644 RepID=UPI002008013D|nr:uncharacterized protein F4812DRAFT_201858 [Daldinia caldariorum]KAI1472001.1 hypothetical protein F4812DRAFT_201858 [Daldinia caldariorum]